MFCLGGFCPGGFWQGGLCPGGFVWGLFVLEPDTAKALQKVEEVMNLVCDRMKLTKVADSSQLGWRTADEYQQDYLAFGSEDEKRLFRSERDTLNRESSKNVFKIPFGHQGLKLLPW